MGKARQSASTAMRSKLQVAVNKVQDQQRDLDNLIDTAVQERTSEYKSALARCGYSLRKANAELTAAERDLQAYRQAVGDLNVQLRNSSKENTGLRRLVGWLLAATVVAVAAASMFAVG